MRRAMGVDRLPFWQRLTEHPAYDEYWREQALDRILAARPLTVPTMLVGSEWDQEDIYGATALFQALKAQPQRASCARARGTTGRSTASAVALGPLNWGTDTARWFRQKVLIPFLDEHLKGGPPDEHRTGHRVRGRARTGGGGSTTGRRPARTAARRT